MKPKALLIDDDFAVTRLYIWELEREGYDVQHVRDPDEAWGAVTEDGSGISVFIVDVMMYSGERYKKVNTENGLRTGVLLYQDIHSLYPDVPVIVLTNLENKRILAEFKGDRDVPVLQKLDYTPYDFAKFTSEIVEQSAPRSIRDLEEDSLEDDDIG